MTTTRPVAVVTGGGSGIGRATALTLAAAGMNVLAVGRRPAPLTVLERRNPAIRGLAADVTVESDIDQIVKTTVALWNRIDTVVNNAGLYMSAALTDITVEQVTDLVRMNVVAPTLLARACLPYLTERGGVIVNVTSVFARRVTASAAHYAATKAALESLTRGWALELAPLGVRVNAVAPGPTDTNLLASSGVPADRVEQIKARDVATIPLQRRGDPDDMARWIGALAAPSASWTTGEVFYVDGGLSLL